MTASDGDRGISALAGGRAASGRRPAAGGGVFFPFGKNTPPHPQRKILGGVASSQAPYPSPLPKGHRLTPSAAPPFPTATLRRSLSCSFGAITSTLRWFVAGTLCFPPGPFLKRRKGGYCDSPPLESPLGDGTGDEGRRMKAGAPPAIPGLRCCGRRGRSLTVRHLPWRATPCGGRADTSARSCGYPGSASIRQSAGGGPMHQRHSFRKPNSVPGFGASYYSPIKIR